MNTALKRTFEVYVFVFAVIYSPPTQGRVGVPLNAVAFIKENNLTGNTFTDPNIWGDI